MKALQNPLGANSTAPNRINPVWSVMDRAIVADGRVIDRTDAAGGMVVLDTAEVYRSTTSENGYVQSNQGMPASGLTTASHHGHKPEANSKQGT